MEGIPITPEDYADHGSEFIQGIVICHALAGGSVHADHFAVEAYRHNRGILSPVRQLEGAAAHTTAPLGFALQRALREGTEGLTADGAERQTLLCLEKIRKLAHANLDALHQYMLKQEGSAPTSNLYL